MRPNNPVRDAYYERQISMPEIGAEGQSRLGAGRVLVIGAGGLASPLLFALAGAGVGRIGILDSDYVSVSNLNRQFLYTPADIGLLKAEQARKRLAEYHPDLLIESFSQRLDLTQALDLFKSYDVIVGAVDNNRTRRIINAACCELDKTWIDGGINGFSAYVTQIIPGQTACFDCLFGFSGLPLPQEEDSAEPKAVIESSETQTTGVIGATAGVIGSIEATLAILHLLGLPAPLRNEIFYYYGRQMTSDRIRVERTPACPICGSLF